MAVQTKITKVSGDNQSGTVGTALASPFVVKVTEKNKPKAGITVNFTVASGGGSVSLSSSVTDGNGLASTRLTLGTVAGTNSVNASAAGAGTVTFTATANSAPPPPPTDSWQVLPYNAPILPIHAALLHTGKIFFFCGSGNDPSHLNSPYNSVVLEDLSSGTFSSQAAPLSGSGLPLDLFCAGQSFLLDGRLMIAGGTLAYDNFKGLPTALLFDPSTQQLTRVASMNKGRWYPTVLTLGDGRILAVSGLDEFGNLTPNQEIYSAATDSWSVYTQPTSSLPLYAHLFLLQDGRVFYSGAQMGGNNGVTPRILTLPGTFTQAITEQPVTGLQNASSGDQAASVLLPPAQDQKVMIIGGGGTTTARVNIVDLKASTPTYTAAPSLTYARMHHIAVLLPDRTVLVCNGSKMSEDTTQSKLPAEIYNPATNTWRVGAAQTVPRVYHSVALLLPDGRVLTAGGNPDRTINELRLEVYSPGYMSKVRPVIQSASSTATYGGTITINTDQAANIKWVSLIRPMANTHSCDTEQRLVDLPISSRATNSLTVTVTNNRNLALPGWYMLFISDNNDVPSVAKWVQLT